MYRWDEESGKVWYDQRVLLEPPLAALYYLYGGRCLLLAHGADDQVRAQWEVFLSQGDEDLPCDALVFFSLSGSAGAATLNDALHDPTALPPALRESQEVSDA